MGIHSKNAIDPTIKECKELVDLIRNERNSMLYNSAGKTIISNEALASLTLFAASSKSDEMETVRKLLISVLNRNVS